ncbi:MAG TPA: aminotransferase class IV [Candidatus Omnitrophota bacterium]|nr:aminotransferase class IV [Candidatus Omnitrophota bacterium]
MFLDGKYIQPDDQLLDDLTPGRRRLRGVFETMRARQGRIIFCDEHLRRLSDGLKCLGLEDPLSRRRWKTVLHRLLEQGPCAHSRVRILVWREGRCLRYAAMVLKYEPPSMSQYRRGIRVVTAATRRRASLRHARVKSLDYFLFADAYQRAAALGFDEALLLNAQGHVFEASRANIFVLHNGVLLTPPLGSGCLDGIMRGRVIRQALRHKIPVRERSLTAKDVIHSDGAFITNALIGVMPLASVDGQALKFPDIRLALLQ